MGVEDHDEGIIGDALAAGGGFCDGIAIEVDHECPAKIVIPIVLGHEAARRNQPGDIAFLDIRAEGAAGEEALAAEYGMMVAYGQDTLGKAQHCGGFFFLQHGPVHP